MRFTSKDLMVSLSPNVKLDEAAIKKLCIGHTRICIKPTLDPCFGKTLWGCGGCSYLVSCLCTGRGTGHCGFGNSCGAGGSACDPTIFCAGYSGWEIENPADLVTLRDELHGLIKELDRVEAEGLPSQFQNRAQADAAEAALENALEQVRSQKKKLQ